MERIKIMKKYIFVILVIIFAVDILKAQETEDIFADRPDVTESPMTMYKNYFQFESGLKFDKFQNDPSTDYLAAVPELLIRFGIIKNL
jgi:hypothetical protein